MRRMNGSMSTPDRSVAFWEPCLTASTAGLVATCGCVKSRGRVGGDSHIGFRVQPKGDVPNGAVVTNQATITLDQNPWISTNMVTNTIGTRSTVFLPVGVRTGS
jgi:hypothetical protein